MYYPYFRGKQYELITIRENAQLLKKSEFVPIIEPVKESIKGLEKAIDSVIDADGEIIVIVNPYYGDHKLNSDKIKSLIDDKGDSNITAGLLLTEDILDNEVQSLLNSYSGRGISIIHAGYSDGKNLKSILENGDIKNNIFLENYCGRLYRRHFSGNRVLLRDGFEKRTNRKHPDVEFFSDLHVTFREEGMDGFGDFLIVGDDYSETGGPAYAIAIHLTFIDPEKDDEMHIHHFKSIRQDDPTDPAGKFSEALKKLVEEVNSPSSKILQTKAVRELLQLHKRGHYPGLGYVKKLSMQHHIETLSNYFDNN
ncbi:MAG TPA: ATP-binding protein [Gammaproteobacteria bacterium]|nr:ATP-binding protein [Gammaproteobacteria bacterium]